MYSILVVHIGLFTFNNKFIISLTCVDFQIICKHKMKNKASFNVSDFLFLLKKSDTISKGNTY